MERKLKTGLCLLFFLLLFFAGCSQQNDSKVKRSATQPSKEKLIDANKARLEEESDLIEAYLKRKSLEMQKSGTGLRYIIHQMGEGDLIKQGQVAVVNYKVLLMTGKVCYSSDSLGPQQFLVGRDYVESGLHEGILLLNKGAKATFILPSHLAHGLTGDQNQIPGNTPVIYEIELINIQ